MGRPFVNGGSLLADTVEFREWEALDALVAVEDARAWASRMVHGDRPVIRPEYAASFAFPVKRAERESPETLERRSRMAKHEQLMRAEKAYAARLRWKRLHPDEEWTPEPLKVY